jgi:hypothetical protein
MSNSKTAVDDRKLKVLPVYAKDILPKNLFPEEIGLDLFEILYNLKIM